MLEHPEDIRHRLAALLSLSPMSLLPRLMPGCAIVLFCAVLSVMFTPDVEAYSRDNERVVIVTAGDTFSSISLREFGSSGYGRLIAEYNKKDYGGPLYAGQLIRIPITTAPKNEFAEVLFAKGRPVVFPRGDLDQLRHIRSGTKIFTSDVIKTGASGFVSLRFPSGTLVNVQPNSTVKLIELDCMEKNNQCVVEMDATEGTVSTQVRRRDGQPASFRVRTPHALAAVRGTIFDIDASAEQLLVGVTEGEVDVQAQGRSTGLLEGLGVKTLAGQPSNPPVRLLQSPSVRRTPLRLSTEDSIGWYSLANAAIYQLNITQDADGSLIAYQLLSIELRHQLQALAPGEYFLNLRGIDADGFKGFSVAVPLVSMALINSIPGPTLQQAEDTNGLYVSPQDVADADTVVEIQLSGTNDFLEVASVDVSGDGGMLYEPAGSPAYVRARIVRDESSVGLFGPVLELPAN